MALKKILEDFCGSGLSYCIEFVTRIFIFSGGWVWQKESSLLWASHGPTSSSRWPSSRRNFFWTILWHKWSWSWPFCHIIAIGLVLHQVYWWNIFSRSTSTTWIMKQPSETSLLYFSLLPLSSRDWPTASSTPKMKVGFSAQAETLFVTLRHNWLPTQLLSYDSYFCSAPFTIKLVGWWVVIFIFACCYFIQPNVALS